MTVVRDKPSPQETLYHHGVKGMKWGVRKDDSVGSTGSFNHDNVVMREDGSIDIAKGASLQRLVRSNGSSLPMKDLTFASINDYDNARYIKIIGGTGFLGGGRDQILGITATQAIKAPSKEEATALVSHLMVTDAAFRKKNTGPLGEPISNKELKQIQADPKGKTANAWYFNTNQKLTFDASYDPDAPFIQKRMKEEVLKKGFNALRDENDVEGRVAKSPIIIFNPQTSLKVTSVTTITDDIRKANKQKLKEYKRNGDQWLQQQLFDA